ncbi:MAG: carbohydrate kinase family protein [Anaerosomatales bacterium]|nr:carbohydrate kinase family protein [Anaerosomatales bacterium]
MTRASAIVCGGANLDVFGFSRDRVRMADSNPGDVRTGHGGVGRNIAENLARLGVEVSLVTAVGADGDGRALLRACERAGIDTSMAVTAEGLPTSRYLAILDERHDLVVAVNDMRAAEAMTPDVLAGASERLSAADVVVLDTNLPEPALLAIAGQAGRAPLVVDTVSAPKAVRARGILGSVHTVKTNRAEAAALLGADADLEPAALVDALLDRGVRRAVVTLGPEGSVAGEGAERVALPAPRVTVGNATGAGDAFTAGLAYAALDGAPLRRALGLAAALASFAIESTSAVDPSVTLERVLSRMEVST